MELEEGEIVLCKVNKIEGTSVFVTLLDYDKQGIIVTSEIAPGRIRNIRDYVVPNKIIACKVLRIEKDTISLSLRRVTSKEKKEALELYKKEIAANSTLRTILKDNAPEIIKQIRKEGKICLFIEKARESPGTLEKYIPKEEAEKLYKIICEKKIKNIEVKQEISLSSKSSDGLSRIKRILSFSSPKLEIIYITAGKFLLKVKDNDYKTANKQLQDIMVEIETRAKKEKVEFEYH